jgi:hypothetical protein
MKLIMQNLFLFFIKSTSNMQECKKFSLLIINKRKE